MTTKNLRIADAMIEAIAKRHTDLVQERDDYKSLYEYNLMVIDRYRRQVAALRGVITKLKRKPQGGKR